MSIRYSHKVKNHAEGIKGYCCQKKFWPFYAWFIMWCTFVTIVEISTSAASSEKEIYQWTVGTNVMCSDTHTALATLSGKDCFEQCRNIDGCVSARRGYDTNDLPSSVCSIFTVDCLSEGGTLVEEDSSTYYYKTLNTTRFIF